MLSAALALLAWTLIVFFTGGIDVTFHGVPIRSRDPLRPLVVSVVLFAIFAATDRRAFADAVSRTAIVVRRHAGAGALLCAAAVGVHAVAFGTFTAGGADAYGYINQAYQWKAGVLPAPIPLTLDLRLPNADQMQAPLGYRVGHQPHTMVPTYAPGLPLIMAVALVAGACGPYFVTPVCAVLLVWFTFRLGARAGGRIAGLTAAVLVALMPVVLFQALWPMSDVPAGAFWTAALLFSAMGRGRDVAVAAMFTLLGLLVRPNLLPLAAVPLAAVLLAGRGRDRWIHGALFAAPMVAVALFQAWMNSTWYGAASNTGYGATGEIYAASNVLPNVKLYAAWLRESMTLWVLIAAVPLVPFFARLAHRPTIGLCAAACAMTFACYAAYSQFEVWWYLRFLLPAAGAFAVLLASGFTTISRAMPQPYGRIAALAGIAFMSAAMISFAAARGTFGQVQAEERRYVTVGEFLARTAPENAAFFSGQYSGSLRFYTGRVTLRFDAVMPALASDVVPAVERAGLRPYLVVDDFELPQVRMQFGLAHEESLPWPIAARMREPGGVTVFDMATGAHPTPTALEPLTGSWCEPRHPIVGPSQR